MMAMRKKRDPGHVKEFISRVSDELVIACHALASGDVACECAIEKLAPSLRDFIRTAMKEPRSYLRITPGAVVLDPVALALDIAERGGFPLLLPESIDYVPRAKAAVARSAPVKP